MQVSTKILISQTFSKHIQAHQLIFQELTRLASINVSC